MASVINLSTPVRSERVRGFQPPWRTVFVYTCPKGHEQRVYANSFRGKTPVPGVGGIACSMCDFEDKYPKDTAEVSDEKPTATQTC